MAQTDYTPRMVLEGDVAHHASDVYKTVFIPESDLTSVYEVGELVRANDVKINPSLGLYSNSSILSPVGFITRVHTIINKGTSYGGKMLTLLTYGSIWVSSLRFTLPHYSLKLGDLIENHPIIEGKALEVSTNPNLRPLCIRVSAILRAEKSMILLRVS